MQPSEVTHEDIKVDRYVNAHLMHPVLDCVSVIYHNTEHEQNSHTVINRIFCHDLNVTVESGNLCGGKSAVSWSSRRPQQ